MFKFLRQMSIPKLSAVILRWIFYLAKYFGVLCFRIKSTIDGQVAMEENCPWWKWSLGIFRIGCLGIVIYYYFSWIFSLSDLIQQCLHTLRMFISIACCLCLLRMHLVQGKDCTYLAERFMQIFLNVQNLCKRKQKDFGGTHELVLLILTFICLTYEGLFLTRVLRGSAAGIHNWITEIFVASGSRLLMHIAVVGYLTLGLLYANLNEYVRTELRAKLESLEEQPTRRKLRKARKSLDKCLTLYEDVQSLTYLFQRVYNLPLLLGLSWNCMSVAVVSYRCIINQEFGLFWHWSKVSIEIINLLLLTMSVHRAKLQFGTIRSLMLESCHVSEDKEWHKTLEVFFTHLNLYEFEVRPLGLFIVSNELMLIFLSALVTYITVIVQYGMQMEFLTISLSKRLSYGHN